MFLCFAYSGFDRGLLNIMPVSLFTALFMYTILLGAILLKALGIAKIIMNIMDGKLRYGIYIIFMGLLINVFYMTVMFISTKQIIYTMMYLPLITCFHMCTLFCNIIASAKE